MIKLYLKFAIIASITISLLGVAYSATSSIEALSMMQRLQKENKIPAYVLEQGTYKYIEGVRTAHVKGKNVFMRSQPLRNARIIHKLTYVDLEYLGEWKHPKNGERWVCVRKNAEIGWIYGQYINLISTEVSAKRRNSTTTNSSSSSCDDNTMLQLTMIFIAIIFAIKEISGKKGCKTENFDFEKFSTNEKYKCCPNSERNFCDGCWELSDNHSFGHILYTKCNYFGKYVQTSRSPQYNAEHLETFEDECCPYYNKYSCGVCPYMDSMDKSYSDGYYKCKHFNAYVEANESPQYNSEHLKYR